MPDSYQSNKKKWLFILKSAVRVEAGQHAVYSSTHGWLFSTEYMNLISDSVLLVL